MVFAKMVVGAVTVSSGEARCMVIFLCALTWILELHNLKVTFFWYCSCRSRSGNRSLSRHKDRRRSRSPLKKRSRSRERRKSRSRSRSRWVWFLRNCTVLSTQFWKKRKHAHPYAVFGTNQIKIKLHAECNSSHGDFVHSSSFDPYGG